MKKLFSLVSALVIAVGMFAADINNSIPTGWTYIPDNPDNATPKFYNSGALKLNFVGIGIQSPEFEATAKAQINFTISALNPNQKTEAGGEHNFTAYGLDANGETVAEAYLDVQEPGNYAIVVEGEGLVAIKLIMTSLPNNGEAFCNVALGAVSIEGVEDAPAPEIQTVTVADAIEMAKSGATVNIEGYVLNRYATSNDSGEWSEKYGNQSFYMGDTPDEEGVFVAFRVKGVDYTIPQGTKVRIENATLTVYKDTPETKAGATVVVLEETGLNEVVATLDVNAPMFNILGAQVDGTYKGIVIQNGKKFILK